LAMARQHDALAGGDPGQQGRQMGLRLLNIDATRSVRARRARRGVTLNDGHNLVWSAWSDWRSRACDWAGNRAMKLRSAAPGRSGPAGPGLVWSSLMFLPGSRHGSTIAHRRRWSSHGQHA
jgi:hypothetical protein